MKIKDIKLLELELHSFCNRACSWCPNSYIDRKSENNFLSAKVLIDLLDELKHSNFKGAISFSRYNEPFAFPDNLESVIKDIKYFLPNSKLVANTNGDYDFSKFRDLVDITEMDYDNNKEAVIEDNFRIMTLKNINNRGGALKLKKNYERNFPCFEPQRFIGINYDGTVSPCCNIRSDINIHKPFVMGDLHYDTLQRIMDYPWNQDFRERASWGINECLPYPCKGCDKEPGRYTSDKGLGGKQT